MRQELREIVDNKCREVWERLILSWVHSEIDRKILTRNLLDDVALERIAEELALDRRTVERHYGKALDQLMTHSED